jgi:LuxR family transcriptional regulator/LuxR family quorum-sensing system transcriptional regulator CciR
MKASSPGKLQQLHAGEMAKQPEHEISALERLRRALGAARELPAIQFAMEGYAGAAGIRMLSYYHFPPVGAVDFGPDINIYEFGFPADWVETYRREDFVHLDPMPRIAAQRTLPFWWSQIETLIELDADEHRYMALARKAGFGDGLGVPVFGPNGRNGYNAVGFGKDALRPDEVRIAEIHAACQMAHLRYCDLIIESLPEAVSLSERERQILGFVVRGRSNQQIAATLNISANTVDTYVRRCFDKLDVHDRVTAGLRGLALGLVA